ncbi:MAG: SDR family NAD(P)-dependent oxidoreductase [Planctomycetota bacterium]
MNSKTPPGFSLEGRTALVTGSSRGLGRAIAFALGRAGAKVAFNYKNGRETAEAAFAAYRDEGLAGGLFRGSVIDPSEVRHLCREIVASLGSIDILIVNATPDQPLRPIEEYDWDFHQQMLDFFVKSPFLLTREVLPAMKANRFGRILNIGSEVFRRGVGNFSAYVAAKGAQEGWTRSMATELAPWNITVNLVAPGWIPVERHANDSEEDKAAYRALIPMNRWGVPDDVGGACVFFASEAASFITGQSIAVNGGMTVG